MKNFWILAHKTDYHLNLMPRYEDNVGKVYQYDSTVPNAKKLKPNDIVFIRVNKNILGFCSVEFINETPKRKDRYRCLVCKSTEIYKRITKKFIYKCGKCKNESNEIIHEKIDVIKYVAHLRNFTKLRFIDLNELKSCGFTKKSRMAQHSILLLDPHKVIKLLGN